MAVNSDLATLMYQNFSGATPNHYAAKTAAIGAVVFTGSGLNDATSGGTYTATVDHTYTVIIDATGTPDTFKWKKDSGSFTTGVSITGSAQTLADGVQITFAATTGHTLNAQWVITVTAGVVVSASLLRNITVNSVGSGAELKIYDGTNSSGTLLYDALTASWTAGTQYPLNYKLTTGLYIVLYASSTYPDLIVGSN